MEYWAPLLHLYIFNKIQMSAQKNVEIIMFAEI